MIFSCEKIYSEGSSRRSNTTVFPFCKSARIKDDIPGGSNSRMLRGSCEIKEGGFGKDRSAKDRTAASSYRSIKPRKVGYGI